MNIRTDLALVFLLLTTAVFAQESNLRELGILKTGSGDQAGFDDILELPDDRWVKEFDDDSHEKIENFWLKVSLPPVVIETQLYLTENRGVRMWEFYLVRDGELIRFADIDWSLPYRNTTRNGAQYRGLTYAAFNQSPGYDYSLYVHITNPTLAGYNFVLSTSENFTRRQQTWSLLQGMGVGYFFMITLFSIVLIFKMKYPVNRLYLFLVLSAGVSVFYISGLGPYLIARILPGISQYLWFFFMGLFTPMVILYIRSFIIPSDHPYLSRYFNGLLVLSAVLTVPLLFMKSGLAFRFLSIQASITFLLICTGLVALIRQKVHAARWLLAGLLLYFLLSMTGYILSLNFDKRTMVAVIFHLLSQGLLTMLFGGAMIHDLDEKFRKESSLRENAEEAAKNAIERMSANERMADLGRLVASVTHELGNPLGVTVTLSTSMAASGKRTFDLFEKNELSEEQFREFVMDVQQSSELIYRNMEQARLLINGFKMVASDQVIPDVRTIDLGQYIQTLLKVLEPAVKKGGYTLEAAVEPGVRITSIPGVLTQVLTNLVNNALIHGIDGVRNGKIRIECRRDNDRIALRVEDNGKGIPDDIQDKVFDIYFTTKKGKGGTGVGLSIVHSLVEEELKGSISFESHPGQGTVFTVLLPENIEGI